MSDSLLLDTHIAFWLDSRPGGAAIFPASMANAPNTLPRMSQLKLSRIDTPDATNRSG